MNFHLLKWCARLSIVCVCLCLNRCRWAMTIQRSSVLKSVCTVAADFFPSRWLTQQPTTPERTHVHSPTALQLHCTTSHHTPVHHSLRHCFVTARHQHSRRIAAPCTAPTITGRWADAVAGSPRPTAVRTLESQSTCVRAYDWRGIEPPLARRPSSSLVRRDALGAASAVRRAPPRAPRPATRRVHHGRQQTICKAATGAHSARTLQRV